MLDRIIDGANPQEPVHVHFPGDDLLTPIERRRGLPIGNLTSQFFANLYLNGLDHFCKEVLRAKGYLRYVNDFALFHDSYGQLEEWRHRIADYLEGRRLLLHPRKTAILPTKEPARFLGFVLLPGGRRRLPEDNAPLSQPPAQPPRPLSGGHGHAQGGDPARPRLDSPRRT